MLVEIQHKLDNMLMIKNESNIDGIRKKRY